MMSAFKEVLEYPHSVSARKALIAELRASGDPRADFIEDHLRKDLHELPVARTSEILRRLRRDLKQSGHQWAGRIADLTSDYQYELGLVAGVVITGATWLQHAAEIVRTAPILHLSLYGEVDLAAAAQMPQMAQMRTLAVSGGEHLNDDAAEAFARSPYILGLRVIDFAGGQMTARGLAALARSVAWDQLVSIDVTGNPGATEPNNERLPLTVIEERSYLLGGAAMPWLQKAQAAAMAGYSGRMDWPPYDIELSYDRDDREQGG
jgi:hypothetical protein